MSDVDKNGNTYSGNPTLLDYTFIGIAVAFFSWLLLCIISLIYLSIEIPITEEDIKNASWLAYSLTMYPSGVMAMIMGICFLVVGCVMWFVNKNILPFLPGLILGSIGLLHSQDDHILRMAIWTEVAKIGCFVESKECHAMLNIKASGLASMYVINDDGWRDYAKWYREKISHYSSWKVMPGVSFLSSPLAVMDIDQLRETIDQQRASVKAMQHKYNSP